MSDGPIASPAVASPQLPVVDLIGLRFSLQHLRLVGYGLLSVWLSEILNLLTSPGLGEIGARLQYISQFLDLSPILLVSIGLIAFQGGLRRAPLEVAVLPLLLTLLPLLSAFHFFLAPVSVANAVTLTQKQQQIGRDQIERIDQQTDRASAILRDSDSIEALLSGLERIPGLQVRVPPDASVADARVEVRRSLQRERNRLRQRIEQTISSGRDTFLRRALTNAVLALLVGLLLWGLHHGAMREMEQAIPFLDWVLVQGQGGEQPEVLEALLHFQRLCVSFGWFAMLGRCLRLVRQVVRRPSARDIALQEKQEPLAWVQPPPNPFEVPSARPSAVASTASRPDSWGADSDAAALDPTPDPMIAAQLARRQQAQQWREERRRRRDLDRYRAIRQEFGEAGLDPFGQLGYAEPEQDQLAGPASDPAAEASGGEGVIAPGDPSLEVEWEQERLADLERQRQFEAAGSPPPPRGLAALWRWFITHI